MVKFLHDAGESPATATSIAGALGNIAAPSRADRGEIAAALTGLPAILGIYTRFPYRVGQVRQAFAATLGASVTMAPACQSIGMKPAVCSTRRSQARIAGKVARS